MSGIFAELPGLKNFGGSSFLRESWLRNENFDRLYSTEDEDKSIRATSAEANLFGGHD